MSLLIVLIQLLMFLSVHACNARSIGVLDKDLNRAVSHHKASIPSQMTPTVSKEVAQVGNDDKIKREQGGATTMTDKGLEILFNGGKGTRAASGNNAIVNSQIDMQQEVQLIKEMKKQGRSMQESKPKTTDKEAVESNENEIVEDVVVMDYASPHRKPPIHNEKP